MNKLDTDNDEKSTPPTGDIEKIRKIDPTPEEAMRTPSMRQFNILIVDDQPYYSNKIEQVIETNHKERIGKLTVINDFGEAIRMVQRQKFDLVISDMKDQDGRDMGEWVTKFAKIKNEDCYVIGMSSSPKSKEPFIEAGADDFIDKNFDASGILDKFFNKK